MSVAHLVPQLAILAFAGLVVWAAVSRAGGTKRGNVGARRHPRRNGKLGIFRSLDGESAELPDDAFDANGFQGQYLTIVPSKKLVVVRLGATSFRGHDHDRLPRQVIEALR